MHSDSPISQLLLNIHRWADELGFQQIGISDVNLNDEQARLQHWIDAHYHGSMNWIEEHVDLRVHPEKLVPGTTRVISARMNYLPADTEQIKVLKSSDMAYISRYALGRDYHKLMRKRLARLAGLIEQYCIEHQIQNEFSQRPFVDSAPVMERPLAQKAGLGWIGKHTLLIHPHAGSWFFLGEIYTNVPLPTNESIEANRCGECQACLKVCPTDAFPQPYVLDARRCISYLTIENKGAIPVEFREVLGNRVFGCDDCQAICPWNKYAQHSKEDDFQPRHGLQNAELIDLFNWDEPTFLNKTSGSAIRRIGYRSWLRNLAVGIGNAASEDRYVQALENKKKHISDPLLEEHFNWALTEQKKPAKRRKRKLNNKRN